MIQKMSALIKMQTGYIWLLSDGESALEDEAAESMEKKMSLNWSFGLNWQKN